MKQLIIIISIALCVTNGFSQCVNGSSQVDSIYNVVYTQQGYVDYYKHLNIPRNIGEEEFLNELDKFFRSTEIEKGYKAWQLHGFDYKRGTFYIVEFIHDLTQPINSNQGKQYFSEYLVYLVPESKSKK
jgi:hypothetical protein